MGDELLDRFGLLTLTRLEYYGSSFGRGEYQGGILIPDHRGKRVRLRSFGWAVIDDIREGETDFIVERASRLEA